MRFVSLPAVSSRPVPLGRYVALVKAAKRSPEATFKHGLTCWWPVLGREVLEQFRDGVSERIREAIPYHKRGEKA